jgi:hypothetical protein
MEVFRQTSDAPYDRHTYSLVLKTGETVNFDDWDAVQVFWFTHNQIPDYLDYINVLDKSKKKTKAVGF